MFSTPHLINVFSTQVSLQIRKQLTERAADFNIVLDVSVENTLIRGGVENTFYRACAADFNIVLDVSVENTLIRGGVENTFSREHIVLSL